MNSKIKTTTPKSTSEKEALVKQIQAVDPKADKVILIAKSREALRTILKDAKNKAANPEPTPAPAPAPAPTKTAPKKATGKAGKAPSKAQLKRNAATVKAATAPEAPAPTPTATPEQLAPIPAIRNPGEAPTPEPAPKPGIALKIFGANLRDQSKGSFVVHTATCKDCKKLEKQGENVCTETHDSALSVSRSIWADHIASNELTAEDGLCEIYFHPCVKFPGEAPAAPAPAPQPAPVAEGNKRYVSKTPADSKYHLRDRSEVESPVTVVRNICNANIGKPRKDIVALCIAAGVNKNTAATQYSFWKVKYEAEHGPIVASK